MKRPEEEAGNAPSVILAVGIVVALLYLEPPASYAVIVDGAVVEVTQTGFWLSA